jgi:hypothetical protein
MADEEARGVYTSSHCFSYYSYCLKSEVLRIVLNFLFPGCKAMQDGR